jgi:alkanesulfonate monooxygenase SsuD/methylene tetrahydromethanopterin reductase-like flavin-dependent oxidoreductase (luciferase family)
MTAEPSTTDSQATAPGAPFPFRFGLALPTSGPLSEPETIFEFASVAESSGFDDVWVNDHLNWGWDQRVTTPVGVMEAITDQEPNFFESVTTAAAVLGRVSRIGVGIGGLAVPMRDPRWLAKQIGSLHELTGRRISLGLAQGMVPRSYEIMQIPYAARGRLYDEYVPAMRALWEQTPPVTFKGERVAFEDALFYPRPVGLRVLLAGDGERVLGRVARMGDGWLTSYADMPTYARKVRILRDMAVSSGRDPDELDTASMAFICVAPSLEEAIQLSGPSLEMRFGSIEHGREVSIIGTADEAIDQIVAMHRAGMRSLQLRPMVADANGWIDMVHVIASDVLPVVRSTVDGDRNDPSSTAPVSPS